jgi:hypothetical protein
VERPRTVHQLKARRRPTTGRGTEKHFQIPFSRNRRLVTVAGTTPPAFSVHLNLPQEETMSTKDEYVAKMKKQLDDWSTGIDELQVKASLAKAELKVKYEQQIAELRKKKAEGDSKLNAVKAAADDSWEHLKGETERTWNALKGAVEEFKSRMK